MHKFDPRSTIIPQIRNKSKRSFLPGNQTLRALNLDPPALHYRMHPNYDFVLSLSTSAMIGIPIPLRIHSQKRLFVVEFLLTLILRIFFPRLRAHALNFSSTSVCSLSELKIQRSTYIVIYFGPLGILGACSPEQVRRTESEIMLETKRGIWVYPSILYHKYVQHVSHLLQLRTESYYRLIYF